MENKEEEKRGLCSSAPAVSVTSYQGTGRITAAYQKAVIAAHAMSCADIAAIW